MLIVLPEEMPDLRGFVGMGHDIDLDIASVVRLQDLSDVRPAAGNTSEDMFAMVKPGLTYFTILAAPVSPVF